MFSSSSSHDCWLSLSLSRQKTVIIGPLFVFFQMLLLSQDYGKHLLGVEDLLQKHALVETDIAVQAERVKAVNTNANKYSVNDGKQQSAVNSGDLS